MRTHASVGRPKSDELSWTGEMARTSSSAAAFAAAMSLALLVACGPTISSAVFVPAAAMLSHRGLENAPRFPQLPQPALPGISQPKPTAILSARHASGTLGGNASEQQGSHGAENRQAQRLVSLDAGEPAVGVPQARERQRWVGVNMVIRADP